MLQKCKPLTTVSPNMCIMYRLDSELGALLFLNCILRSLGIGLLVSLKNRGFVQCIHMFILLNLEVLALVKMQRSCGGPRFMPCFGVFGWKWMLEFLVIPFQL